MFPFQQIRTFRNRYFAMRHGHSFANEEGIVLSDPARGVPSFGLTPLGAEQATASARDAFRVLDSRLRIFTSDFARARETANIVQGILHTEPPILSTALRERWFGSWECTSNTNYASVWEDDAVDPHHEKNGVESAVSVQRRTASLILEIERVSVDRSILLVSHGDALQILQTAFARVSPSLHRSLPHLETAEIRELVLAA